MGDSGGLIILTNEIFHLILEMVFFLQHMDIREPGRLIVWYGVIVHENLIRPGFEWHKRGYVIRGETLVVFYRVSNALEKSCSVTTLASHPRSVTQNGKHESCGKLVRTLQRYKLS
jgi:hypothetical protein